MPTYLDDNGNPIAAPAQASPVYLDDNGDPIASPPPGPYPNTGPTEGAVIRGPQPGVAGFLNRAESSLEGMVRDQPEGVKETMLSPERGVLHMAQGVAEGSPLRVAKGVLEAATLPTAFLGPESAGAGKVGKALEVGGEALSTAGSMVTKGRRAAMADRNVLNVLNDVAERSGLQRLAATTTREGIAELGSQFRTRASSVYQAVDKAVGGELQPVLDKMEDLRKAIKANAALDPEKATKFAEQLAGLGQQKGQLVARAAQAGVADAEQAIKIADRDWFQFRSLERASKNIKTASGEVRGSGIVTPGKLATAVDALENSGKLSRALGAEGAKAVKDVARTALSRESFVRGAKTVGKYLLGGGLLGGGLYKILGGKD